MPYKTQKIRIDCPFLDRRCKLLPCQREMIHYWHAVGVSINKISKMFNVNKRLVQFELFPERKEKNLQDRRDRGSDYYKGGAEWASTIREHRRYKQKLFAK
jgi:IS30 family transposase